MFRVQRDDRLSRLQHIAQQEFQQVALPLAAVTQDEHVGVGLVSRPTVQVHNDVGPEFLFAQVDPPWIRFAGVAHGI